MIEIILYINKRNERNMSLIVSIKAIADNESTFNVLCHRMAKNNASLAYKYIKNIFDSSIPSKDRCNDAIKAFFLTVRIFPLCVPGINRITRFVLRLLSPPLTMEFVESPSYFGIEERKIRYSSEDCLVYLLQDPDASNIDRFIYVLGVVLDKEELHQSLMDLLQEEEVPKEAVQNPKEFFGELIKQAQEHDLVSKAKKQALSTTHLR